jgi:predicted RecA/RadA family phage recombinase
MRNKITEGNMIPYAHTAAVVSGQAVKIGNLLGVAATDGAANEAVEYAIAGVYELPKTSADVVGIGALLYWNDTAKEITTTATGNLEAGRAYAAAAAGVTSVRLLLNSAGQVGA